MRKIIQLAAMMQAPQINRDDVRAVEDELRVVALCDDGSAWAIRPDSYQAQWERLPDIPQNQ